MRVRHTCLRSTALLKVSFGEKASTNKTTNNKRTRVVVLTDQYVSYIYILYLHAPHHPFLLLAFHFCVLLSFLCVNAPLFYFFVVSSRTIGIILTSLPCATKIGAIDL
jgi:hypothetical protein